MARAVIQRVRAASVQVEGQRIASIGGGLAILIGVRDGDTVASVDRLADKIAVMRIFEDAEWKMNLSAAEVGGKILVVSQFTLYADVRKGRRPSFVRAGNPEVARELVDAFAARLVSHGFEVETGEFGAHMLVTIENDGPVTIILDSEEL